jgi:hypothetical protein
MSSCCTCSIPNLRPPAHSFLFSLKSHCRAVAKCVHSRSKARLRKLKIIAKLATVLECDPAELLRISGRPNT